MSPSFFEISCMLGIYFWVEIHVEQDLMFYVWKMVDI